MNLLFRKIMANALCRLAPSLVATACAFGCSSGGALSPQDDEVADEVRVKTKALLTVADGKRLPKCANASCASAIAPLRVYDYLKLRLPTKDPSSGKPIAKWTIAYAEQGGGFGREVIVEGPFPARRKNIDRELQLPPDGRDLVLRAIGSLEETGDKIVYAWVVTPASTPEPECDTVRRMRQTTDRAWECQGGDLCVIWETTSCRRPGGRWYTEYDGEVGEACCDPY